MKAQGRLLLVILCSVGVSAAYILLCCWACLPFCLASCLGPRLSNARPTAPGPLPFSGYSRVPDGKPLVRGPCHSCAVVSSSGQMLGSGLGTQIDGAECVLRMNQAPTVGFEADVGQRSTLRVISHTTVPLLLRNYSHYFQQARDTLYVVWGQGKNMDRTLGGRTYRTLLQLTKMYPGLQVYTFTERMMAYCDQVFQNETGKNRRQSGSFLSTGWFTMILALELCEEIVVYGMVSDSYCRSGQPGPGQEGRWGGRQDRGPPAGGPGSCGAQGVWASGCVVEAWPSLELVPRGKGLSLWGWLDAHLHSARVALGQTRHLPAPPFPYCEREKRITLLQKVVQTFTERRTYRSARCNIGAEYAEKSHPSVPYHYFEKGRLDECQMYLAHEQAPRSAHRFITEKAVFSRWAKKRPLVFAHPSWRTQ